MLCSGAKFKTLKAFQMACLPDKVNIPLPNNGGGSESLTARLARRLGEGEGEECIVILALGSARSFSVRMNRSLSYREGGQSPILVGVGSSGMSAGGQFDSICVLSPPYRAHWPPPCQLRECPSRAYRARGGALGDRPLHWGAWDPTSSETGPQPAHAGAQATISSADHTPVICTSEEGTVLCPHPI
jgi:hypothetical protein